MTFGQVIAEGRKRLGISQKTLAANIKKEDGEAISPQYLNDIERDRRNPPSEYLIAQFAKELQLSKDYLLLAAGTIPKDIAARLSDSDPEKVDRAFRAFRKTIK